MQEIDARGLDCPAPVVKTKKALENYQEVTTIVDNQIAAKNVSKMGKKMNCNVEIREDNADFKVVLSRNDDNVNKKSSEEQGKVYFIKNNKLGKGKEELGSILMKGFIYTLLDVDPLPKKIIFMNSGVKIPTNNEDAIESLKKLQEKGVNILACGTCLDYYGLEDKLAVGSISNMYEILDSLNDNETKVVSV